MKRIDFDGGFVEVGKRNGLTLLNYRNEAENNIWVRYIPTDHARALLEALKQELEGTNNE